jgi:hypothetical protein
MGIMLLCLHTDQQGQEKHIRNLLQEIMNARMLGTEESPGIMFQTLKELFMKLKDFKVDREYNIRVSFLEIYNE